jgi:F1F0 ATPase subunit 2
LERAIVALRRSDRILVCLAMDAQAMTNFSLTGHDLIPYAISAGPWLTVGALIGASHFLALRWNIRMLAIGRPLPLALATQLVRFAFLAGVLTIIASHFGAFPLLAAAAGILAARTTVLRFGQRP